jgi:hypothetical protein
MFLGCCSSMRGVGFLIIWSFTVQLLFCEFAKRHSLLRSAKGIDPGLYRLVGFLFAANAFGDVPVSPDPYLYESAEMAVYHGPTAGKVLTTTPGKTFRKQKLSVRSRPPMALIPCRRRSATMGNEPLRWSCVAHARNNALSRKLL